MSLNQKANAASASSESCFEDTKAPLRPRHVEVHPKDYVILRGPFCKTTCTKLKLVNRLSRKVAFRVMCTIPKMYCIRPHVGTIGPFKTIEMDILFLPTELANPAHYPSKHRFLIQSIVINENDECNIESVWKHACPDAIVSQKLGVVFIPDPQKVFESLRKERCKLEQELRSLNKANCIIMVIILILLILSAILSLISLA